jgi:Uma2 family endonuclease
MTYDEGRLVATSPLPIHERWRRLIGRLVETLTDVRNIPIASLGNSTWKRKDLLKGLEGDECDYIQHEPQVRRKLHFDLTRDPPPDLAIEIDVTHSPAARDAVYAGLGIPELWNYDGKSLRPRRLVIVGDERRYEPIERSLAFPFLDPRQLERFIAMLPETDENSIVRAWREWVVTLR